MRSAAAHRAVISGSGAFLPGDPIPYDEADAFLGEFDQVSEDFRRWYQRARKSMKQLLAIEHYHYALDPVTRQPTETPSTMAAKAGKAALKEAGVSPEEVDLLLYAGATQDCFLTPPTSTFVQQHLGIARCAEMSIHSNCTSTYKALQIASDMIALGRYKKVLVTSANMVSVSNLASAYSQVHLTRNQAMLRWFLSDGAGAVVVERDEGQKGVFVVEDTFVESLGMAREPHMFTRYGSATHPIEGIREGLHHVSQDFAEVSRIGPSFFVDGFFRFAAQMGWNLQDLEELGKIQHILVNLPSDHLLEAGMEDWSRRTSLPLSMLRERYYSTVAGRGYTGPAAVLISLEALFRTVGDGRGVLESGNRIKQMDERRLFPTVPRMIPFQFRTYAKLLVTPSPMRTASTGAILRRAAFFLFFPGVELIHSLTLSLDSLFFSYKDTPVSRPLFVVSPPRSGSTLLQRLLAKDVGQFTSFALWQLIFPALWIQVLFQNIGKTSFGGAIRQLGRRIEARLFRHSDRYHRIRMEEAEEDEILFVHACASELLANLFPIPELWKDYRQFDQMEEGRRKELMAWYRSCVVRHQYLAGPHRQFISKSPPFCHKIKSIKETFPDARFVFLVRHPEESLCSCLSMLHAFRSSMGLKGTGWKLENTDPGIIGFVVDCYKNALAGLAQVPEADQRIVLYDDLARDPVGSIAEIYQQFGMDFRPEYRAILEETARKGHERQHHYELQQFGLDSATVEAMIPELYERFGFERRSQRASA